MSNPAPINIPFVALFHEEVEKKVIKLYESGEFEDTLAGQVYLTPTLLAKNLAVQECIRNVMSNTDIEITEQWIKDEYLTYIRPKQDHDSGGTRENFFNKFFRSSAAEEPYLIFDVSNTDRHTNYIKANQELQTKKREFKEHLIQIIEHQFPCNIEGKIRVSIDELLKNEMIQIGIMTFGGKLDKEWLQEATDISGDEVEIDAKHTQKHKRFLNKVLEEINNEILKLYEQGKYKDTNGTIEIKIEDLLALPSITELLGREFRKDEFKQLFSVRESTNAFTIDVTTTKRFRFNEEEKRLRIEYISAATKIYPECPKENTGFSFLGIEEETISASQFLENRRAYRELIRQYIIDSKINEYNFDRYNGPHPPSNGIISVNFEEISKKKWLKDFFNKTELSNHDEPISWNSPEEFKTAFLFNDCDIEVNVSHTIKYQQQQVEKNKEQRIISKEQGRPERANQLKQKIKELLLAVTPGVFFDLNKRVCFNLETLPKKEIIEALDAQYPIFEIPDNATEEDKRTVLETEQREFVTMVNDLTGLNLVEEKGFTHVELDSFSDDTTAISDKLPGNFANSPFQPEGYLYDLLHTVEPICPLVIESAREHHEKLLNTLSDHPTAEEIIRLETCYKQVLEGLPQIIKTITQDSAEELKEQGIRPGNAADSKTNYIEELNKLIKQKCCEPRYILGTYIEKFEQLFASEEKRDEILKFLEVDSLVAYFENNKIVPELEQKPPSLEEAESDALSSHRFFTPTTKASTGLGTASLISGIVFGALVLASNPVGWSLLAGIAVGSVAAAIGFFAVAACVKLNEPQAQFTSISNPTDK